MPDDANTTDRPPAVRPASWRPSPDRGATAGRRSFQYWAHGMARLFQELADFTQMRVLEESAMWDKLASCRDSAAAAEMQRRFAAKASADCAAAGRNFAQLFAEIGRSCGGGLPQTPHETD